MKRIFLLTVLLVTAGVSYVCAETARNIVDKADEAFKINRVYSISSLTIYKSGKAQPAQIIEGYTMERNGRSYSLTIYKAPRRMKGTAVLMIDNDLWVRFASTGRVRKLSSSAKKNSAGGSDFSYADMGENGQGLAEKYSPSFKGEEKIDGISCFRIELAAVSPGAPYEKLMVFISKDDYRYIRIDYYEDNANIKTMKLSDYRVVNGINYPFKVVMESHVKDSRTEIVTKTFEGSSPRVKARYFTTGYLQSIR